MFNSYVKVYQRVHVAEEIVRVIYSTKFSAQIARLSAAAATFRGGCELDVGNGEPQRWM